MKISQLIKQIEMLDANRPRGLDDQVISDLNHVIFQIEKYRLQTPDILSDLKHGAKVAGDAIKQFDLDLDLLRDRLLEQIKGLEPSYLANSSRLYIEMMLHNTAQYILDTRIDISDANNIFIQSRIKTHSHWQLPGLIIRPSKESWIEHMVACDPLYVIDISHELFEPVKSLFNPAYQRRLRYNVINEMKDPGKMQCVPDDQIGLCLVYNFFNFRPVEIIRPYLVEIYTKLRPGGVLAMTFNDCDRFGAVLLAENNYTCYTPGRLIKSMCETIGFKIEYALYVNDETLWIELRKPGHRTSLRGGQSLAEIVEKPTDSIIEPDLTKCNPWPESLKNI